MSVSIKVTGTKETLKGLNDDVTKLINQAQRISAFQAVSALTFNTPVDKGRARSSWILTRLPGIFKDGETGFQGPAVLGPVPTNTIETLYITNGTPYITDLNAGSSLQAPPRFIEVTVSKYFNTKGNFVKVVR